MEKRHPKEDKTSKNSNERKEAVRELLLIAVIALLAIAISAIWISLRSKTKIGIAIITNVKMLDSLNSMVYYDYHSQVNRVLYIESEDSMIVKNSELSDYTVGKVIQVEFVLNND